MTTVTIPMQWRNGIAALWTSANPTLLAGEPGFETDTLKYKIGDGATAWNSLPYQAASGAPGPQGETGPAGPAGPGATLSDATPKPIGTAAPGTGAAVSREDHVHAMPTAADVGADPAGTAASAVGTHEGAADPHPQYTTAAEASSSAPVQSVAGRTGAVTLAKADVGLGNADNTSDASKPISTAQQSALDGKFDKSGGVISGGVEIQTPTITPLKVCANLTASPTPSPIIVGPNSYTLLGVAQGGGPYISGSPYVWLGNKADVGRGYVHCSFGYAGIPAVTIYGPSASSPTPQEQVIFRLRYQIGSATANAFETYTPGNVLSTSIDRDGVASVGGVRPVTDNVGSCGDASHRWTEVWATNGAIQTSDARRKTPVSALSPTMLAIGLQCAREVGQFRWLDRLAEKGDAARWHIGITVQRVIEIFAQHGEDAFAYGIACYDEWAERTEIQTPAEHASRETGVLDEDGMPEFEQYESEPAVMRTIPAGDAYSLRYDELALLMTRATVARQDALEARIVALEAAP